MKKTLLFTALTLAAAVANADNELVEFSVKADNQESSATMRMGSSTLLQLSQDKQSGDCNIKRDLAGTPVDESLSLDVSNGLQTVVLPVERNEKGVRTFIDIRKQSAQVKDWVVVEMGCKLPVGSTSSISLSTVDTFEWGQPTKLKLSDGSVVIVTANK